MCRLVCACVVRINSRRQVFLRRGPYIFGPITARTNHRECTVITECVVIREIVQVISENVWSSQKMCGNHRECAGGHRDCAGYHRECVVITDFTQVIIENEVITECAGYHRECVVNTEITQVIIGNVW